MQRILAAKASKMRKTSETLIKIFLTIDDFDLPLLLATESSYISEAEDFYRKLFPLSILEIAKEMNVELRVIISARCILDIPDCLIGHPEVDSSLAGNTRQTFCKSAFGLSHNEIRDLCTVQGITPEQTC